MICYLVYKKKLRKAKYNWIFVLENETHNKSNANLEVRDKENVF
jgi:hypothetical protein